MPQRRNLIIVIALAALLLVALVLIGSLLSDLPATAIVALATPTVTPTSLPTNTPTPLPTYTPTETPTVTITLTPYFSPCPTPLPTPTVVPTARARIYLSTFSQVFAVGQAQPNNSTQVLMYEGNNDPFEVLASQGPFTQLQTVDGGMNFWTATTSVIPAAQPPPQYDYSVRGRTATLFPTGLFACAHNDRPTLAFGACQTLNGVSTATLVARVTVAGTSVYLAEIGGAQYFIPTTAVISVS